MKSPATRPLPRPRTGPPAILFPGLAALFLVLPPTGRGDDLAVAAFGARADGVTDDTTAIQKALDEAAKAGGTVKLGAARYLVAGSLRLLPGVGLEGGGIPGLERLRRAR
jgi:hypothetical protein